MNDSSKSLKNLLGKNAILDFRKVLYSEKLTWGAKCLLFSIWDLPESKLVANLSALTRKLHSSAATVFRWKAELKDIELSYFDKG